MFARKSLYAFGIMLIVAAVIAAFAFTACNDKDKKPEGETPPVEYTVTFIADGVTIATETYTAEDKVITEPAVPEKDGYTGAWEDYTLTTGDITVKAEYTPIEYTATFVADGKTVATETYTTEDKVITAPAVPEKEGYTGAWEEYTLTTGDIIVKAEYTPIEYTVTFIADGKTVGTDIYTVEDKTITAPAVPEKEGYTGEWEDYTLTTGDITVEAEYTAIEYTVTFVADGKTVSTETYTAEDMDIVEPAVPEKEGYTGAWEDYTLTTGDITVKAEYTSIEFTVTFIADGKTVGTDIYTAEDKVITEPEVPEKEGYTGAWEEYTLTTGDIIVKAEYTLIEYTVTFIADGKTVGTDIYTVEDKTITAPAVPKKEGYTGAWEDYTLTTGDITVEAEYTAIEYTVTFIADGKTVGTDIYTVEDKTIAAPAVPEKEGYTGAWEEYTLTTGDITVKAEYTPIEYTVTFIADGKTVATETYTTEDKAITEPAVPEKAGYSGKWEEYTLTTGNVIVLAEYTLAEYTVTFIADGSTVAVETYTISDRVITEPAVPEKEGYTAAWEDYTLTTGDITVDAEYTPIEYTVTFIADGKTVCTDIYTVEDKTITAPAVPEKEGYTGEWEEYTLTTGDIIVKAKYTPIEYTVTFIADGKTIATDTYTVEDKNITEPAVPVKSGYTGRWESYTLTTGNKTVNAVYTPIAAEKYDVTITYDDSVGMVENAGGEYKEGEVLRLSATPFLGYEFTGWYDGGELISDYAECTFTVPAHDVSLEARFAVRADMEDYEFISGPDWCEITGIKFYLSGEAMIPDCVTSIGDYAFDHCFGLMSVVIPDSVTRIGTCAFNGCSALTFINIPDGVTSICGCAFQGCFGLTSINIPDSVISIGDCAFNNCTRLTSIDLPDSLISIGDSAFNNCTGLTSINIPANVMRIGKDAFYGCSGIKNITVSAENPAYYISGNCLIETGTGRLIRGCNGSVIPYGVTIIEASAFHGCSELTSITIPYGITSIGDSAFDGCFGLTSINIPSSVINIGCLAFQRCSSLMSIEISANVESIGDGAFSGCTGVMSITVAAGNPIYHSSGNCIIETRTGILIQGCNNSVIPDGVTSIRIHAFFGCSGLTSVVIPDSVTEIGAAAFANCTGLTSIVIPDSVTSVESNAFSGCSGVISITVAAGNPVYHSSGNCLIETETGRLIKGCNNSVIPDGVTSIGDWAFSDCTGLTSIVIPDSVTSIGHYAFSGCTGLTSIFIPDSVTSIGDEAFWDCYFLVSIDIPGSVTEIGANAFNYCDSLASITFSDPYGWTCGGEAVSADILSDPVAAAEFMLSHPMNWIKA